MSLSAPGTRSLMGRKARTEELEVGGTSAQPTVGHERSPGPDNALWHASRDLTGTFRGEGKLPSPLILELKTVIRHKILFLKLNRMFFSTLLLRPPRH